MTKRKDTYTCKVCGGPITPYDSMMKGIHVHTSCSNLAPIDFKFVSGTFHIEARTALMSKAQISRMISKCIQASKATRRSEA